jgi:hypothetical protein
VSELWRVSVAVWESGERVEGGRVVEAWWESGGRVVGEWWESGGRVAGLRESGGSGWRESGGSCGGARGGC